MSRNERLYRARLSMRWSQEKAAEKSGIARKTYIELENGKRAPQIGTLGLLCSAFHASPQELGYNDLGQPLAQMAATPALSRESISITSDVQNVPPTREASAKRGSHLQVFVENDLTLRCLALVYSSHPHLQDAIAQVIKDYDAMHLNDHSARITRREALNRLIGLPIALYALGTELTQRTVQEFLGHCTAGIAAAWEQSKSSEYEDLLIAFDGVSDYLPTLRQIIKDSSPYRQQAANLAMQCEQLKTILAFHLEGPARATLYAQQGIFYATESGDLASQAVAWRQLANSYYYENRYELALEAAQKARFIIEQAQKEHVQIPAYVQSWVHSGLAAYQAQHGHYQDALTALGEAHTALYSIGDQEQNEDPQDSIAELVLWDGMTQSFRGQYNNALASFEKAIDINDPRQRTKVPMGRRMHIEIINHTSLALLKSSQKDKAFAIELWKAGMQGAKELHSQQRFNEAMLAYHIMEGIWPNDPQIEELRDLIRRW
jgi:transcriptional regulator with XRE-family HTH domain/NADH:ubiquinone oxidoreductase subunit